MTGFMMLIPLLPVYAQELDFSEYDIGLLVAAFFVGRVLFQFPLGVLSDHIGRKAIILGSLLLFSIATFGYGLTTTASIMMLLRVLQGVASSGFAVGSQSYINDMTPVQLRGLANGVASSAINAGVVAGPLLGGLLSQAYSLQTPFWVGGALGLGCFTLCLKIPRMALRSRTRQRQHASLATRARELLSSVLCPPCLSLSLIHFLQMFGLAVFLTAAPILAAELLSWDTTDIAIAFALSGASATLLSPWLGQLADRAGRISVMTFGLAVMGAESLAVLLHPGKPLTMLAFVIGGAGAPAYYNALYSLIGDVTVPSERGGVTGFVGSFGEWGSIIGSSLVAPLLWHSFGISTPMKLDVAIYLVTVLVAIMSRSLFVRVRYRQGSAGD